MMENLFNCVCSSLMIAANKEKFLRGEGLQLMNLMLRSVKQLEVHDRIFLHSYTSLQKKFYSKILLLLLKF